MYKMQFLKTKNYQTQRVPFGATTKRKAFTLMEILIAASIFAIVMVIATGILGQSSSFRSKIKAQRDASEDAKKIADMITRDVREAGYPASIQGWTQHDFKSGISLISYDGSAYEHVNNITSSSYPGIAGTTGKQAILTLADKDNYKIYRYDFDNKNIYYRTIPRLPGGVLKTLTLTGDSSDYIIASFTKLNSDNTEVIFAADGFAPEDASSLLASIPSVITPPAKQQPYIRFSITAETKDYIGKPANSRAQMTIQSAVTARSFAN